MLFMVMLFIYSSVLDTDTTWCMKTGDLHWFLVDQIENVSFLSAGLVIADNFLMCVKTSLILKHYCLFFHTASDLLMPWPSSFGFLAKGAEYYLLAAYITRRLSCCGWKSDFAVLVSWPVADVNCGLTAL